MDVWDICDVDEKSSLIMRCFGSVFISWMWMMMLRKIIPKISGNDCAIGKWWSWINGQCSLLLDYWAPVAWYWMVYCIVSNGIECCCIVLFCKVFGGFQCSLFIGLLAPNCQRQQQIENNWEIVPPLILLSWYCCLDIVALILFSWFCCLAMLTLP